MDDKIQRYINNIKDWQGLKQQEQNLATRGMLDAGAIAALNRQATHIGETEVLEYLAEDVTTLDDVERRIIQVIGQYLAIKRRQGTNAGRTLKQARDLGLIDAVEKSVCKNEPTQGYGALIEEERQDLTYEQIVVDYPQEFSARAQWYARRTLGIENATEKPPAATTTDVATRTTDLLQWLAKRALANEGQIPPFSNAEAAAAIGLGALRTYGRVHGNIQSRIDFACYLCDLPPLGCAADQTFDKAWGTDGRSWVVPIKDLQAAAQSRSWSPADFQAIARAAEVLPGVAYVPWRDALFNEEQKVRTWVFRWAKEATSHASKDDRHLYRYPADVLAHATPDFIWIAIQQLSDGTASHTFGPSTDFDLVVNDQRLPPKAVLGVALTLALGEVVEPRNFAGGEGSPCFRILRAAGYTIVSKGEPVAPPLMAEVEPEWAEGGRRLVAHWRTERAPGLSVAKKAQFKRENGRLFCERCQEDPAAKYGPELGDACIEVHHKAVQVSDMAQGHITSLNDLECLCANCHRVTHKELRLAAQVRSEPEELQQP